jgi:hypothetical protein
VWRDLLFEVLCRAAIASTVWRISSSLKLQANLFQLFQPSCDVPNRLDLVGSLTAALRLPSMSVTPAIRS